MLPFEFTVPGPPVSYQSHNRRRLQEWRDAVARAARQGWAPTAEPAATQLRITVVYFFERGGVYIDNDNLLKPIQDALTVLVYRDDRQIVETRVSRRNLDGRFRLRGLSWVLADAFVEGRTFLFVRVEEAHETGELF